MTDSTVSCVSSCHRSVLHRYPSRLIVVVDAVDTVLYCTLWWRWDMICALRPRTG